MVDFREKIEYSGTIAFCVKTGNGKIAVSGRLPLKEGDTITFRGEKKKVNDVEYMAGTDITLLSV